MPNDLSVQDSDYDGAWKEALRRYFPEILQCYFPAVAATIDWQRPLEWSNKEQNYRAAEVRAAELQSDRAAERQNGRTAEWQHSTTPTLHYSSLPTFHHSNTPPSKSTG
jgi:hypothetical protein